LDDDCSLADPGSTGQLIDLDLYEVATAKLTVDRQIEECAITEAMLLLKEEANSPHLLRQERALGAKLTANIPRGTVFLTGIVDCMSHAASPQANSGREENGWEGGAWWEAEGLLSGGGQAEADVRQTETQERRADLCRA
jgi:hypothetical protein